ncbi:MAG: esterase-like activity of phytase family protein [Microcoleus sp. PH2017_10_PVI_O_A]|uniref:esterase-like activity of phytase family protein n=1 Tax=unclassified Microcoleus TaxID=2642155 RepID=UPI001E076883|nr:MULTISPECIES: esterase-like activity of phytase family protein [unclassified Microcoleus]TAE84490.1 MAG: esterase-like activity of phytase family protein [Oscillatoriales cyanobacterium]MCC3405165.1 esterase-like activity of phytase family protein [Microcoleus sp. PH2017_10_PVI_O_A]MCC3459252.1 esterase-like activity of phytase family protein [Microcoleus sp. PH2017_11_PCY_U_A]MCC3477433.1 esterase-like activity of phytase family protein [Microcoleus sp. PH2017_12_PCY_D_A]MCC3558525.1 ester
MRNLAKATIFIACFLIAATVAISLHLSAQSFAVTKIDFIGRAIFPTGSPLQGTEIGGLSAITYDADKQVYYAISDDRSSKAPARFYSLKINLASGKLEKEKIEFTGVTTLLDENGKSFPELSLDPEGIAFTGKSVFVSSEGDVDRQIAPFIKEFSLDGKLLKTLLIPDLFLPDAKGTKGIRNNLAFESLTLTGDRKYLFTATENATVQDGAVTSLEKGSPCRILRYDAVSGNPDASFLYITEALPAGANPVGKLTSNGLVDLLAIDDKRLISLERAFSLETGTTIRIFEISLEKADRIEAIASLKSLISEVSPAQKRLLLDLETLKIPLDNIEGLTFGPDLADGSRGLILVSDNNFSPLQETQILGFQIKVQKTS